MLGVPGLWRRRLKERSEGKAGIEEINENILHLNKITGEYKRSEATNLLKEKRKEEISIEDQNERKGEHRRT